VLSGVGLTIGMIVHGLHEHSRQVAALAAVSAAPVVYCARREASSEGSYSINGSKDYGFLAFRQR
jgi:hypothetical protein